MPEPPGHPRFDPHHEPSFTQDRTALGLSGANFDFFFRAVEDHLCDYPTVSSTRIEPHEDIWALRTRDSFPDVPPLIVYYRVQESPNMIIYLGLSHDWSKLDIPPDVP